MKILVAGDWHSDIHETAVSDALTQLGHDVVPFAWHGYFDRPKGVCGHARHLLRRAQNKYVAGPLLRRLNRDFVRLAQDSNPDAIFVYRGTHITRRALEEIHNALPHCVLVGYNNDDPLGPGQPRSLWKHFFQALPEYDLVLAYRHHNVQDFSALGARRVELLRSWFIPGRNRRVAPSGAEQKDFECEVVFVGHYESDHRVKCLEEVVKQGWKLRLFGPGYDWDPVIADNPLLKHLTPVRLVWGDEYSKAISGAKIALCFLSKLNRDTYTRRCFEIPAMGTLLMSEYTDDLASLYAPDQDAVFFRDRHELVEKLALYLEDDALRQQVAQSGHRRVMQDGHDVVSRMGNVVEWVNDIREKSL